MNHTHIVYIYLIDYLMEQRKHTYRQWLHEVSRRERPASDLCEFEIFKGWIK